MKFHRVIVRSLVLIGLLVSHPTSLSKLNLHVVNLRLLRLLGEYARID